MISREDNGHDSSFYASRKHSQGEQEFDECDPNDIDFLDLELEANFPKLVHGKLSKDATSSSKAYLKEGNSKDPNKPMECPIRGKKSHSTKSSH